jgi:hypothetical protein
MGALIRSFSQLAAQAKGTIREPTVWQDGARPPPKYVFKNKVSLMNLKIQLTMIIWKETLFN